MTTNNKTLKFNYKNTVNPEYWENYLGRHLEKKELFLLKKTKCEYIMNKSIDSILEKGIEEKLFCPKMTQLNGNCLFDSLKIIGLFDEPESFRIMLSTALLLFKDVKNFIPNQELTMEEIFNFTNEIEVVYCKKTKRFYKYNYVAMCYDLIDKTSWCRLPTQLIFMVISYLFDIVFKIVHDTNYITEIKTSNKELENCNIIWLGLIGESHYFPMLKNTENVAQPDIHLREELEEFHKWARRMSYNAGNYEYV